MQGKWLSLLVLGAFLWNLIGCGTPGIPSEENRENLPARSNRPKSPGSDQAKAETPQTKLVKAYNEFGFALLAQLVKQDTNQNLFLSPLGLATALTMTYNGAAGETKEAMAKVLGLAKIELEEVNQASAELRHALENLDPKVELILANSLWARQGIDFKADFLERNRQFFGAEIATLDFDNPQAPALINQWVESRTKGKINKIVEDKIDPETVLFLINALYFKGKWKVEFDKKKTQEGIFYLSDGKPKPVARMVQSGKYPYFKGEKFQAISLPYGEGRISLFLFLPGKGTPLSEFLKQLNRQNWEQWQAQFHPMEGDIAIPRFKIEYEKELSEALKALGMAVAFDRARADFSGMRPIPPTLFIQRVKHKAVMEVNEEGTEAAAATSVEIGITSVPQKFTFVVDRPFFFAISDNQTGAILFMGAVMEP